jgi:hypothetical protein
MVGEDFSFISLFSLLTTFPWVLLLVVLIIGAFVDWGLIPVKFVPDWLLWTGEFTAGGVLDNKVL